MADSDPEVDVTTTGALVASTDDILSSQHDDLTSAVDSITGQVVVEDGSQQTISMITPQGTIVNEHGGLEVDASQMSLVSNGEAFSVLGAGASNLSVLGQTTNIANGAGQLYLTEPNTGESIPVGDNLALQNLLAGTGGNQLAFGSGTDTIQIIAVANSDLASGKLWQVIPSLNANDMGHTFISINQPETGDMQQQGMLESSVAAADSTSGGPTQVVDMVPMCNVPESLTNILMPPPPQPVQLPPGTPTWAARLRDCEKIGDAYRGWVESEVELDLLLTFHKQQTQSLWGTRQSPSPAKQSTRLMWKSQYVPFDGVPFVNTGSRAIVMECQYGPRRKGAQVKKSIDGQVATEYKQTCPARIYIKKVRKFHEFQVELAADKKAVKCAMEKAFQLLKERGIEGYGQERFYVQLPTEKAHEFHSEVILDTVRNVEQPHRLHPRVAQRIREMVSAGETRLYAIRKGLRRFVERDLFSNSDGPPEKHNLSYYPTVNDLQNHIQTAIQDIENGSLPVTAPTFNVEMMGNTSDDAEDPWNNSGDSPHAETVTVTLTQNPGEDGHHVISKVETHLSDGTTRISSHLTLETAQLLSKLHPNMFPAGSILQEKVCDAQSMPNSTIQKVTLTTEDGTPLDVLEQESDNLGRGSEALTTLQVVQREATELVEAVQMGVVTGNIEDGQDATEADFIPSDEDALQMGAENHLPLTGDFIATSEHNEGNITIVTAENGEYMFQYTKKEEDSLIQEGEESMEEGIETHGLSTDGPDSTS